MSGGVLEGPATALDTDWTRELDKLTAYTDARDMPDSKLKALKTQRDRIDSLIVDEVERQRLAGMSWVTIGDALGVSKQAAQQRYGR